MPRLASNRGHLLLKSRTSPPVPRGKLNDGSRGQGSGLIAINVRAGEKINFRCGATSSARNQAQERR
ncbi:MAG: hypothetical protein ACJ8FV_09580, partial [Xanthobacteraceae bacterium]